MWDEKDSEKEPGETGELDNVIELRPSRGETESGKDADEQGEAAELLIEIEATAEISADEIEILAEEVANDVVDEVAEVLADELAGESVAGVPDLEASELSGYVAEEVEVAEDLEELSQGQLISIVESILFSSDKPVSVATIKQAFVGTKVRRSDIKDALRQLSEIYADSQRGVFLEEVAAGYQLRTKLDNANFLRRVTKTKPFRLSGPALEVLSIVAYKQPVVKSEVDEIRGVESGHVLRGLMEKGLVSFEGKSDLPGKPMQYATTRKFLEIFGLRNIQELPTLSEIDELIPEGIGGEEEIKETLNDVAAQLGREAGASYSENEEELEKIAASLDEISTSSEFFEEEKRRQSEKREAERAQDIRERLAVGEEVTERDKRWLERFDAKLNAPPEMTAENASTDGALAGPISNETTDSTDESNATAARPDRLEEQDVEFTTPAPSPSFASAGEPPSDVEI